MEARVAVPSVGAKQGATALFAFLNRAVFIIGELILRAHILASALETKDAALAVVAGEEWRARNAKERLEKRQKGISGGVYVADADFL